MEGGANQKTFLWKVSIFYQTTHYKAMILYATICLPVLTKVLHCTSLLEFCLNQSASATIYTSKFEV